MQRVERFIEINAPVEQVFDLFSDFESFPRWMRNIRDVRRTGRRTTHWVCETALDMDIEWEAELTVYEPDHRIVWRSFRGDVDTDGEAIFTESPHGTTLLHMVLGYDTPSGRSEGEALARFFGRNPERQLAEDLARFRRFVEQQHEGDARRADINDGDARQAYGRRSNSRTLRDSGEQQRRFEGERNRRFQETRGEVRRDDARHPARDDGRRERDDFAPRDFNESNYERRERVARSERQSERERRFNEALREARRSQLDGMRRYARERDEQQNRRPDVDEHYRRETETGRLRERRRFDGNDDFYRETRGRDGRERDRGEQEEYRFRHSPTPKGREGTRGPSRDDMERSNGELFRRRGVERLLEDPPSSRFNRERRERE